MEAKSVEDNGEGIEFCVYVYNVQPGVTINYETGDSCLGDSNSVVTDIPATSGASNNNDASNSSSTDSDVTNSTAITETYIINENTHKFHKPSCSSVSKMNEANKKEYTGEKINGSVKDMKHAKIVILSEKKAPREIPRGF